MKEVLTELITSTSSFRADIAGSIKRAGDKPFAVLSNNKPSFYVVPPELFAQFTEMWNDLHLAPLVQKRIESARTNAIEVDVNDL